MRQHNRKDEYYHPLSFHRPDSIQDDLYVITTVFNPHRYRSRLKLYKDFEDYVLDTNEAKLVTVEVSYGQRDEVIQPVNDRHQVIHLYTKEDLWLKEAAINIGISRLPKEANYIAWMDADVTLVRPDWVGETLHQLQRYDIIQMFSLAMDVDPNYVPYQVSSGFVHDWMHGVTKHDAYNGPWKKPNTYHTGYAWAARKTALNDLGGLLDWAILGSADNHMARALIGEVMNSVNKGVSQEYKDLLMVWQDRADKYIKKNVGYMEGGLIHYFHGAKQFRRYKDRWQILVESQFAPSLDLKRDWNGLWQLTGHNPKLKRDLQLYFAQRNEDNIDMKGIQNFNGR